MFNCWFRAAAYFTLSMAIAVDVSRPWWPTVSDASQMAVSNISSSWYHS